MFLQTYSKTSVMMLDKNDVKQSKSKNV